MNIGKQIKRLRTEKNITQEVLSDYLGVSAQAVSKWENDITTPDIGLLPEISVFFGVKIDELFRLPNESHFERIENMFHSERAISDENFKYAEGFLNEKLDEDKKNARALGDLAHLYNHRAKSLHEVAGDYAKAALALEPESKSFHVALWDAYHAVCGDGYYDNHFEVIQYYKDFLKTNPNQRRALIILIENLLADQKYSEAKKYVNELKTHHRDYTFYMYLGDITLAEGNLEEAKNNWNQGVNLYPKVWQAYCSRADRLARLGLTEEAISDYEKCMAVQESPRIVDGLLSLAQIYEELKDYNKAIEVREKEIEIYKTDYKITSGETLDRPRREIERLLKLKK
ncbi:MAG: helix-turn-helix domain-containing protein [Clostridia bacterium]|nr:helix-turn-helix domain-containing protein [Clostridia bacterium]